jgi:hypothetical protein
MKRRLPLDTLGLVHPLPLFAFQRTDMTRATARATPSARLAAALATAWLVALPAQAATTLTFDDLAEGVSLSNQYAALGVLFSANAFAGSNANSTPEGWASNTGMTVTAEDLADPGSPALASGKVLHSFGDFLLEDGDPSIRITFTVPVISISLDFLGIDAGLSADVSLTAYNGLSVLGTVVAANCAVICQQTLNFTAASITHVNFTPGSVADWVAVDNISFVSDVPEASTISMLALGLAVLALRRPRG